MHRYLLSIILLSIGFSTPSYSAACCTSAAIGGVGRLLIWEKFATGLSFSLSQQTGRFNTDAQHEILMSEESNLAYKWDLWGIAPILPTLSAFVRIPVVYSYFQFEDYKEDAFNLDDIQLGLRYQLVGIGEYKELPGIALSSTLGIPSATGDYRIDISRRAVWSFSFALSLEKTWQPFFIQSNSGISLPTLKGNETSWKGPLLVQNLALGVEAVEGLVFSLIPQFTYEHYYGAYDTSLAVAASWRIQPHLTVQLSTSASLPFSHLGRIGATSLTSTFGIRYGYF